MKIQKIIDLCKKSGELYITNANGVQWVGNGKAMYPLIGCPDFTPESLLDTFGVSEDTQSKMILNTKELKEWGGIEFGDLKGDEVFGEVLNVGVAYSGRSLLCVKCEDNIYFINRRYFNPYEEDVELYKRSFGPIEYFVIANGLLVSGIVLPEMEFRAQLAGDLKELARML